MPSQKIINEVPLSIPEVKEEVARIKERDKELNFRMKKVEESLNVFSKIEAKDAQELYDKIMKLKIPRLKDRHVKKIIDILPMSVEEFRSMLTGSDITLPQDSIKKIIDLIKSYKEKK